MLTILSWAEKAAKTFRLCSKTHQGREQEKPSLAPLVDHVGTPNIVITLPLQLQDLASNHVLF